MEDAKGNMKTFSDFESYVSSNKNSGESKHRLLQNLVEEHLDEIQDEYQFLKDNCWTARYINYQIDAEISKLCHENLTTIQEICTPPEI